MSTVKGCLLGVALVVVVVTLVVLFVSPSHPPDSPATSNHPSTTEVTGPLPRFKAARFGCAHREYFEKVLSIKGEGDDEAAHTKLLDGAYAGECTVFKKGEEVYLHLDGFSLSSVVQVRRPGETAEYWTDFTWLDTSGVK